MLYVYIHRCVGSWIFCLMLRWTELFTWFCPETSAALKPLNMALGARFT